MDVKLAATTVHGGSTADESFIRASEVNLASAASKFFTCSGSVCVMFGCQILFVGSTVKILLVLVAVDERC